jgi:hypothetical protein
MGHTTHTTTLGCVIKQRICVSIYSISSPQLPDVHACARPRDEGTFLPSCMSFFWVPCHHLGKPSLTSIGLFPSLFLIHFQQTYIANESDVLPLQCTGTDAPSAFGRVLICANRLVPPPVDLCVCARYALPLIMRFWFDEQVAIAHVGAMSSAV